ncbi:MAG: tRNA 2-thiouridine(34) synthase MnmA [Candidatus Berkelbacteria bacterium]|nr:tRNA 2-thiouridine(34) synthase MnmA [Candidatus Berkelbacteria bacterium]
MNETKNKIIDKSHLKTFGMNSKGQVRVAVGMSGGVDSSVAALLLKEQGFDVIGLFLKFWSDPLCSLSRGNACCDEKALMDARAVAAKLDIPFYVVDCREQFKKDIADYYLEEYRAMRTPNPCVVCNKKIKFGWMVEFAAKLGCGKVATGHYCRITTDGKRSNGELRMKLQKGIDEKKDQSYFMWQLDQAQLSKIIFPLGEMTKAEVREIAKKADLPVYEKAESQEICFIQDKSYVDFLRRYLPEEYFNPGRIVDKEGWTVGRHDGIVGYTIGQRKKISQSVSQLVSKSANRRPLYVIGFNLDKNEVVVGDDSETYADSAVIEQVNFLSQKSKKSNDLLARIRYRAEMVSCKIEPLISDTKYKILFKIPQRAVTPGQSAVFYIGEEMVGGGIITGERVSRCVSSLCLGARRGK